MKKKIFFILVFIFVLSIAAGFFLAGRSSVNKSGELSDRAKEFIGKKQSSNDTSWRTFDQKGNSSVSGQVIENKKCYTYKVPFFVKRITNEKDCFQKIFIERPSGFITSAIRSVGVSDLDEVPDVSMRKKNPGIYKMEVVKSESGDILMFSRQEEAQEFVGFYFYDGKLFTVALSAVTNQDLKSEFKELVKTIKITE